MRKITLTLAMMVVLSLIVYAIMAIYEDKTPETIAFPPLDQKLTQLDKVYEKWFPTPIDILATEDGTRVVCAWHQYLALSSKKSEGHQDALKEFNDEAMDFVINHGIQALYWASLQAAEDLIALRSKNAEKARGELLNRCQETCPKLDEKLDDNLETFDIVANAEGFYDKENIIRPEKKALIKLLHRKIWNKAASKQFPLENIQTPEENKLFHLWAIESSQRSIKKKFDLIDEYKTKIDKNYDDDYAKAVLYLQIKDRASACEMLKNGYHKNKDSEVDSQKYRQALKRVNKLEPSACEINALDTAD